MIANCKNGISSYEMARALGITQKSAWFMLHRIRLAMKTGTIREDGRRREADETFVGGLAKNMHETAQGGEPERPRHSKTAVLASSSAARQSAAGQCQVVPDDKPEPSMES